MHTQLFVIPWTVAPQATYPWDFPGSHTRLGCHFLLQGSNPCLYKGATRETQESLYLSVFFVCLFVCLFFGITGLSSITGWWVLFFLLVLWIYQPARFLLKIAGSLTGSSLYITSHFSLVVYRTTFAFDFWQFNYNIPWYGFLWIHFVWNLFGFLDIKCSLSSSYLGNIRHYYFK